MMLLLFSVLSQVEPTPTPKPEPAPSPSINVGSLVDGIVNGLLDGLGNALTKWAVSLPEMLSQFLMGGILKIWNGIWDSGTNLLATPFELTIDYPPARILAHALTTTVYAIAVLAVVLLALRALFRTLSMRGGALGDVVDGLLFGSLLSSMAILIIEAAFLLTFLASTAIGRISYQPAMKPESLLQIGPDIILGVFTFIVMIVYGWKLLVRAAYRVVLLMFLWPFAPVAGILWAIPQTRWISVLYWVTMSGWLAGGFLAIGAVSLAIQIGAVFNTNAILSLVFGVALIQLAYDLMAILPRAAFGGVAVGSPFGSMLSGVAGVFAGGAMGAAGGAAAGAAAGAASGGAAGAGSASMAMVPAGSAGSLAETGFGY